MPKTPEDPLRRGKHREFTDLHRIDEKVSAQLEQQRGKVPKEHLVSAEACLKYIQQFVQFGLVVNSTEPTDSDQYRIDYLTGSIFVDKETGAVEGLAIPETTGLTSPVARTGRYYNPLMD